MSVNANVNQEQITASVSGDDISVAVSGGIGPAGPTGPAGAGGVTSLQGLTGGLTLAAVGGTWAASGSTITLTVTAASAAWDAITGKPATFPPSAHTHDDRYYTETEVDSLLAGKQAAGSYAAASHAHTASAITDFSTAALAAVTWSTLTGKPTFSAVATSGAYADLSGKPTLFDGSYASLTNVPATFAPAAHNQAWATITSTPTTLSGYGITDAVSSSDARLTDARTPTAHNQAWSTITSTPTTLTGYGITDAVGSSDARLSDARTPTDGSVTDAKITSGGLSTSSLNWAAIQPWAANTAYQKGDLVSNNGIAYRRSVAGTSGATFNSANWQQITPSEFVASQITSGTIALARLPVTVESSSSLGNSGTSATLSLTSASVQRVTLSGNCTFTMPSATAGASLTLILTQGGSNTAAFTGVKWPGGTAPTITPGANAVDVITFVSDGTNWYGVAVQNLA